MKKLNHFHHDLYQLIERLLTTDASSVTIKTGEATIVFELKKGCITGHIYEHGSLSQVWMHGQNSVRELLAAFEALGVCLYDLIKKLTPRLFGKSKQSLLVDLSQ